MNTVIFINISFALLGLIVAVFILQAAVPGFENAFILDPNSLQPWMLISPIFLHGGLAHLFFNGYALFAFGLILEQRIGKMNFLKLFMLAGIAGNITYLATIMLGISPSVPALGASGAIYGILGALAVLTPELVIYLYFFPVPIRIAAVLWILIETLGSFNPSGIASAAHLGGLLFGIAFGLYYKGRLQQQRETFRW